MRKKRNQRGQIDYRQTIRTSLKTGGVPIDIRVKKKYREKPVILRYVMYHDPVYTLVSFPWQ